MDVSKFDEAFASLPASFKKAKPVCSVLLGSGWNRAVDALKTLEELPYSEIPHLGKTTVIGHSGRLLLCELSDSGAKVLAFCGRRHFYEGTGWEPVVMPVVLSLRLGVRSMLVTNAAGGISLSLKPGDMVVIRDHLNLSGNNPLRGKHIPEFGTRFPDQSQVYSPKLSKIIFECGKATNVELRHGVYAFSCGPVYETPAEIRSYGILGGDIVGMSTVPEAIVASASGLEFAAISFVSNMASGIGGERLSGEEVITCARSHSAAMSALVIEYLQRLCRR